MARRKLSPPTAPKAVAASVARVSAKRRIAREPNAAWQEKAWRLFDSMGELRFATSWIANSTSQIDFRLGKLLPGGTKPVPVMPREGVTLTQLEIDALKLTSELGGGPAYMPELSRHLAELLVISGMSWIVIEPDPSAPTGWLWRSCSNDEIRQQGDIWEVRSSINDGPEWDDIGWRPVAADAVVIRLWRRHPRYPDQPDSPVRAVIPILEQLEGIDGHINATSESRLAGAGILFAPAEVDYSDIGDPDLGDQGDAVGDVDGLLDVLVDNARRAKSEPGEASAVVPLPISIPAAFIESFKHMTFWTEYNDEVVELSDRAIRRFALGMDMPPEVVTGMSEASHWGAWRVAEEGVTIHVAPLARVIATGLTLSWLYPSLEALGYDEAEFNQYVIYGDTTDLLVRPDRSADAISGYQELYVSEEAARRESGLSEEDRPSQSEFLRRLLMRALDRNPELAGTLLPVIAKEIITPSDVEGLDFSGAERQTFGVRALDGERSLRRSTDQAGQSQPTPMRTTLAASGAVSVALVASMDGVAHRALERAGNRLRSHLGKGVTGGNAAIAAIDPTRVHTLIRPNDGETSTLLSGAFDRVPELAVEFGADPTRLSALMAGYVSHLLNEGEPHTIAALTSWLENGGPT